MLVVLTGGGFYFETKQLLRTLAPNFRFVYLTTAYIGVDDNHQLPPGRRYPVPSLGNFSNPSRVRAIPALLSTLVRTLAAARRERADCAVVVGCSHAIPVFLACRTLRLNTIFVESITRANRLSTTGHIVYGLHLADQFIVQWPTLQESHKRALLGTIL